MRSRATGGGPEVPLSTVFEILRDERRRAILSILNERGACTLADLVAEVGRREGNDGDEKTNHEEVTYEAAADQFGGGRRRIEASLVHAHLPKLEDTGVVRYDADRAVYRPDRVEAFEPFLAVARRCE